MLLIWSISVERWTTFRSKCVKSVDTHTARRVDGSACVGSGPTFCGYPPLLRCRARAIPTSTGRHATCRDWASRYSMSKPTRACGSTSEHFQRCLMLRFSDRVSWRLPFNGRRQGRILGRFPDAPSVRKEAVIAIDRGDRDEHLERLGRLLRQAWERPHALVSCAEVERLEFYLDLPGHPAWSPLVKCGEAWGLSLGADVNASFGD